MSVDQADKTINIVHVEGKFLIHQQNELDKLIGLRIVPKDLNRGCDRSLFPLYGLLPEIVYTLYELNLINFVSPSDSLSQLDVLLGKTDEETAQEATISLRTEELFPDSSEFFARSKVFRDLWLNGYYVTCGQKFGCHYLAYEESPDDVHSTYMVYCLDDSKSKDSLSHIPVLERVASQTCKKVLLAHTSADTDVPQYSLCQRFVGLDRLKRTTPEETHKLKRDL